MTRKEFTSRTEALSRRRALNGLALLGLSLAEMFALKWLERGYGDSIYVGVALIPICVWALWTFWSEKRLLRKLGLLCPHCALPLDGPNAQHARMTGSCRRCGKGVFANESSATPRFASEYKLTKAEFVSSLDTLTCRTRRRHTIMLLIGFGAIVGCLPLVKYLNHLTDLGRVEWMYPAAWFVVGLLAALLFGLTVLSLRAARGKQKDPGVPCPECGRPLLGPSAQVALTTGICVYCGAKIFEEIPGA